MKSRLFIRVKYISLFLLRCTSAFYTSILLSSIFCTSAFCASTPQPHTTFLGGWYHWDPYQYLANPGDKNSLTGLDYELEKAIMTRAGYKIEIPPVPWEQHNKDLETGQRDFGMGAFYSEQRSKYNYLSVPYRYEENSVFVRRDTKAPTNYTTIPKFIETIKKNNLVIGVVKGYRYANDLFNAFVDDPKNSKYLVKSETDNENLTLLLARRIDGFMADRIVGATIIWREKMGHDVAEVHLDDSKAPIYMLLSKKSVPYEEYRHINSVVKDFIESEDYKKIISWYLYPVLLLETIDSLWFFIIEIFGIISFAISGIVVASRVNASLLGTFILAILPSFGGGIMRDVIFGRFPIGFLLSKIYIILVIGISILGFFSIKFFHILEKRKKLKKMVFFMDKRQIFNSLLVITDAIGLAAFTISGVLVCMLAKLSPLWLWGPFLAFLSGAGGGFIRDIIIKNIHTTQQEIQAINGNIYGEVAIFWGGFLSTYLFWATANVNPTNIKTMVLLTIGACFLTRLLIYYYNIPNLYFYSGKKINDW